MLPHISASEIFLGCTILILSILCVSAHSSVSNLGRTQMVQIRPIHRESTENNVRPRDQAQEFINLASQIGV